jgi:hypothetical protein
VLIGHQIHAAKWLIKGLICTWKFIGLTVCLQIQKEYITLEIVQWSLDKQLMQQEKIWHAQELCDASFHTTGSSKYTILFLSCRTICETNVI